MQSRFDGVSRCFVAEEVEDPAMMSMAWRYFWRSLPFAGRRHDPAIAGTMRRKLLMVTDGAICGRF
jgi:hypothetical protein